MRISKKIVSILLLVAMLITNLPIGTVYAGNNDTLPSNPSAGKGLNEWKYHPDWEGVRISMYWAPSEKDFINGTDKVVQIGETKDFSKTGPRYKVDEYTTYSIYRYMNGDSEGRGKSYKPELDIINPYYYVAPQDSSIVVNMPAVFNGKKIDWDNWVESNDYKNVPEIARLLGANLKAEDFIRGNLDVEGYKAKGLYKLFIEPIIYPTVDDKGMVLTLRDAIRWEEAFDRKEITPKQLVSGTTGNLYTPSLTMNLLPIFEYVANSQFLIEDEPAISMTANSSNYRVDGSTGSSTRREEVKKQIQSGGKIYNSMGVGVFTSPNLILEGVPYVVESYVKIIGVNPDGSLIFEEIKETEVKEAELDEKGALKIDKVKEIEEGTAYFNDIIVSKVDLTEESKISWVGDLPKAGSKKINPTAFDITQYRLGEITGTMNFIVDAVSSGKEVVINGKSTNELDSFQSIVMDIMSGKFVDLVRLQKALLKVAEFSNVDTFNYENASPEFKQAMLEIALEDVIKEYNKGQSSIATTKAVTETLVKYAIYISDLNEVYLDEESFGTILEIPNSYANPTIEIPNFKASPEDESKHIAYIRYIVIPDRNEVIFNEIYKDGVLVDRQKEQKKLPKVEEGVTETYFTDLRGEGKELVSWGTAKGTPLLDTMPSSPIKSGITYEPIVGLESDENIYVTWKTETFTGAATHNYLVDEWRLSKYTDSIGFNSQAYMGLSLRADKGHATSTLSPSGKYNYDTVNPNGLVTDKNYNPLNMNYNSHLHSKAITQGSYSISHGSPSVFVDVTGNINLIKSTALSGLRVASWTADSQTESGLKLHNLEVSSKGVTYSGGNVISKSDLLKYGIKNKDTYTHNYGVRYHYTCHHTDHEGCHDVCRCYTLPETPTPTYSTADYRVDSTFERYKGVNTDSRLFKLANVESKVDNGKTTYTEQSSSVLNLYPEIPMLFDNDAGNPSIKYVVGEEVRKVQPITYHTMEYTAYVKDVKATGMSVATDSRAKTKASSIGLGGNPVVHKGSGINISAEVKLNNSSAEQGILTVKTYALDVSSKVKNDWGNNAYNTSTINDTFLSKFGSKQGGKWVFPAKANERLFVASSPAFEGISKINDIKYNEKSKSDKEYKLTVRGGVLTHVDGTAISTIKTSNPDLYEALVAMRLVGTDKNTTILATFEHQTGKALTEQSFKDLAKTARGVDNLELGKGWYSEDSTVLVVREHTTVLNLPNVVFTDKIPMTVSGLQTPVNKQQFYSVMAKGHNIIRYEVGSNLKSYFEHNTNKASSFGNQITSYGVPNVSISDTMGFN